MDNLRRRISDHTSRLLSPGRRPYGSAQARNRDSSGSSTRGAQDGSGGVSRTSLVAHTADSDLEGAGSRLPIELLLKIFEELPLSDILRCRGVCKRFQQIIDETPEMQYRIELHVSGYKNNDENVYMGASARLEALKAQQMWWKTPPWGNAWRSQHLEWVHMNFIHNQYYDNVWVRCDRDSEPFSMTPDNTRWNIIHCVCFEQAEDGTPIVDSWTLQIPFWFESFTANPSRGELYVVDSNNTGSCKCFRLWTLSLVDGSILCDQTFESETLAGERRLSQTMYCEENVTAIMTYLITEGFNTVKVHIILLDRVSGNIIDSFPRLVPADAQLSFQLISKDRFLFNLMEGGNFMTEVYVIAPKATAHPRRIQLAATFDYPAARQSYVFAVGHSSFDLGRSRGGLMSRNAPPRPFFGRSSGAQLLFILRSYGAVGLTRILHCVPMTVFTSAADTFSSLNQPAQPPVIPWESWGPHNTRCFIDNDNAVPGSHGYQILRPDFTMLNFNPIDIARDLHRVGAKTHTTSVQGLTRQKKPFRLLRSDKSAPTLELLDNVDIPGCAGRIVREPTIIRREAMFSQDIVTTLPYRETKLYWTGMSPEYVFGGEMWVACTRDDDAANATHNQAFHILQVHQ